MLIKVFTMENCPLCKSLVTNFTFEFQKLSSDSPLKLDIVKLEDNPTEGCKYDVKAVPMILILNDDGSKHRKIIGNLPLHSIKALIGQLGGYDPRKVLDDPIPF